MEDDVDTITSFARRYGGLNKSDIQIYLAMLKTGTNLDAKTVIGITHKARNTVHLSLKRLLQAGLISEHVTTGKRRSLPKLYFAVNPSVAMKQYMDKSKKDFEKFRTAIDTIEIGIEHGPDLDTSYMGTDGGLWLNISRDVSIEQVRKDIAGAKRKIYVFGRDCSWRVHILEELKNASERGIEVKIIGDFNDKAGKKIQKEFSEAGLVNLTSTKLNFLPFCLIDDERLILVYEAVAKGDKHICLNVENGYWIERFKNLFEKVEKGGGGI